MAGAITTDKQKRTMNWFGNMNGLALLDPADRPRYFPSKDGSEIYQIYDGLETEEPIILYPQIVTVQYILYMLVLIHQVCY